MSTETGGPAFPVLADVRPSIDKEWCGMTPRDYFAAKAMQGALSDGTEVTDAALFALWCYEMADAMIKARGKL